MESSSPVLVGVRGGRAQRGGGRGRERVVREERVRGCARLARALARRLRRAPQLHHLLQLLYDRSKIVYNIVIKIDIK